MGGIMDDTTDLEKPSDAKSLMSWNKTQEAVDFDKAESMADNEIEPRLVQGTAENNAEKVEKRGRIPMDDALKVKAVPLKLSKDYRDKLEFQPGETWPDRVKYLLDIVYPISTRERLQVKELKDALRPCSELAVKCMVIGEDNKSLSLRKEYIKKFWKASRYFDFLLKIMHFDIPSITGFLTKKDIGDLELMFRTKTWIQSEMKKGNFKGLDLEL